MGVDVHEEWTDQLSEYLDDELDAAGREAVEQHLRGCADCRAVLNDLKRVVAQAQTIPPSPLQADLWDGVAAGIQGTGRKGAGVDAAHPSTPVPFRRRFTFTVPQLAAAAVVLMAVSAGIAWQIADRSAQRAQSTVAAGGTRTDNGADVTTAPVVALERDTPAGASIVQVAYADAQYDAAVADLEKALKQGRGRLDASTIAIVEHNLQIIDQAIAQAREALSADPANSYLSGHLVEARRRKLDLLRRATALTSDTN
ncbi:MAG: zf-HC2 domain-containing protein [Acidobacteria bacterium]|nr:zf-HC2 domain-containing protein [Acidobacteriota bacterium]